jgi:hypothetical protein
MDKMKGQSKKRCRTVTLTSFFSLASTPVISSAPSVLFPTIDEEMVISSAPSILFPTIDEEMADEDED